MNAVCRRLTVLALGGCLGATAVGLAAPDAASLVLGILALGIAMILAILFYVVRPLPMGALSQLSDWPTAAPTPPQHRATSAGTVALRLAVDNSKVKRTEAGRLP